MSSYITEVDILEESRNAFLTYAEEVLTDRAVPNAEDGLLSVHRKLIWTMEEVLKMNNKSKFKKSASVVGSTLASSYFHGDSACYGALCKITQPYLMRYPLIDGDGNLGTQEGNGMEAAARYTNCKPSKYADLMMGDFKKNTVPLKETYNGEYMEPVYLPSIFPNALANGRETIAIGLSHNSLPNNLSELCDGIIEFIKNPQISVDEIMEYIKGPDFPLGGVVINAKDIKEAYRTGRSKVSLKVRGDYEIDKDKIIFTTIPYRTYRNKIKEQINKNIDELDKVLDDFSDESNVGKNRLVFHVKKGVAPEVAVRKLFELTDLQTTLSYNMNFIIDGTPKMCSLLTLIEAYVKHQHNVMINAAKFDKEKAEKRIHILKGLILAVDKIEEVIQLIKKSESKSEATKTLINFLSIDEIQAKAILDMKLGRLTKIDKNELVNELKEKEKIVEECNLIITNEAHRNEKLIEKILVLKKNYGDKRRTKLENIEVKKEDKEKESIIPEDVVVTMTQGGYIKRIPKKSFKVQRRNGKGIKNKDDTILSSVSTNTTNPLLLFSAKGKMYRIIVNDVPAGTNATKGSYIGGLIKLDDDDSVVGISDLKDGNQYVVFFTKKGLIKKTKLSEYDGKRKSPKGVQALKFREGDSLASVSFINEEPVLIVTKKGYAIKFETSDIAPIGKAASGVKAINLGEEDEVLKGLPIKDKDSQLGVFLKEEGLGKRVDLKEFPIQNRGGRGVLVAKKEIQDVALFKESDSLLITGAPNSICIKGGELPLLSRTSMGNSVIKDSKIKSVTVL